MFSSAIYKDNTVCEQSATVDEHVQFVVESEHEHLNTRETIEKLFLSELFVSGSRYLCEGILYEWRRANVQKWEHCGIASSILCGISNSRTEQLNLS